MEVPRICELSCSAAVFSGFEKVEVQFCVLFWEVLRRFLETNSYVIVFVS